MKKLLRHIKSYKNYILGKGIYFRKDKSIKLEKLGDNFCGWNIKSNSLKEDSIVYSFGLGENISFEIDTIKKYKCNIFAYDPTPRAINYTKNLIEKLYETENFAKDKLICKDYALAEKEGYLDLYFPKNDKHVSLSCIKSDTTSGEKITVESHTIEYLMKENAHDKIDLLKMDIEGAEYSVLEGIIDKDIISKINQICIEFHYRTKKELVNRNKDIIKKIKEKGFSIVFVASNQEEFSFIKTELL